MVGVVTYVVGKMCARACVCVAWASRCGMGRGEVGVEGGADCEEVVGG